MWKHTIQSLALADGLPNLNGGLPPPADGFPWQPIPKTAILQLRLLRSLPSESAYVCLRTQKVKFPIAINSRIRYNRFKSTYFETRVVHFSSFQLYTKTVQNKGGSNNEHKKLYAESIAKDYSSKETSKIRALKKLDAKAKLPAIVFTYSFGINSALVFGLGMCLAMRVIGTTAVHFALGIGLGLLGMAGCIVNYPIYKKIFNKGKEKYGYEIIEQFAQCHYIQHTSLSL